MIRLVDNKVYLNEEDFKGINGIWNAFSSDIEYCAMLLEFGVVNHKELETGYEIYHETVDSDIPVSEYVNIFKLVFIDKNYEIVE